MSRAHAVPRPLDRRPAALCELRLGRPEHALSAVNRLLEGLQGDLAERPGFETIDMRWSCQQVLDALGDARSAPLLVRTPRCRRVGPNRRA